MNEKSFQDFYPEEFSHCYGCGRLNDHGLQIKSHWDKDESVALFLPQEFHMAVPGFVYGGLIASLVDCHCVGTAAAATYKSQGRDMGSEPPLRFVTASLKVDFLAPTPLGPPLEIRATVKEITPRKVMVDAKVLVEGEVTATGEVVAAMLPESMLKKMGGQKT